VERCGVGGNPPYGRFGSTPTLGELTADPGLLVELERGAEVDEELL
jgi:hypothetical protein